MTAVSRLRRGLGLVFDLDGVIVDSNPVHREAWIRYNRCLGIETSEEMLEFMYGKRNDEIVRHYFGSSLSEGEIAAHGSRKEALYRELMREQVGTRTVPGVASFLRAHAAHPAAIASNAERANIDFLLEATALGPFFQAIVDGGQVKRPKPHPEIYQLAAALLGIEPSNAIVFEDSYAGVEAARAAGARVVGIRTTHRELANSDLMVDNFLSGELMQWLERQEPVRQ